MPSISPSNINRSSHNSRQLPSCRRLIIAGLNASNLDEVYFVVDCHRGTVERIQIDTSREREQLLEYLTTNISKAALPFGFTSHEQMLGYYLHPHAVTQTPSTNNAVVSFKQAPYFRLFNSSFSETQLVFHEADSFDHVLSSTNSIDERSGELMYSRCSGSDKLRRYERTSSRMPVELYRHDLMTGQGSKVMSLQDFSLDSIHQVSISPTQSFIVGVDMNLEVESEDGLFEGVQERQADPQAEEFHQYLQAPFLSSGFFVYDLSTTRSWIEVPSGRCAAHVQHDPLDPEIFYVSLHNMSKLRHSVVCHGPGTICKYRYHNGTLTLLGEFTHPTFYRITTMEAFSRNGEAYLAVTGYASRLFIIRATDLSLAQVIDINDDEIPSRAFVCPKNKDAPLFLSVAECQNYIFMVGNSDITVVELSSSTVQDRIPICEDGSFMGTAHTSLLV